MYHHALGALRVSQGCVWVLSGHNMGRLCHHRAAGNLWGTCAVGMELIRPYVYGLAVETQCLAPQEWAKGMVKSFVHSSAYVSQRLTLLSISVIWHGSRRVESEAWIQLEVSKEGGLRAFCPS